MRIQTGQLKAFLSDIKDFSSELSVYLLKIFRLQFLKFEAGKGLFVTALYRQRGKLARRLMHSGMAGITAFGVMIAPIVAQEFPNQKVDPWQAPSPSQVLSASIEDPATQTEISEKMRDKIMEYVVQDGDTVGTIAAKFDVSEDTLRWQNNLNSKDQIKVGQTLEVLPTTGILHKVQKGDTIHSIAKKYDAEPQAIVDFDFNTFVNDETFELAVGQTIMVPEGIRPQEVLWSPQSRVRQITPDAGTVVASGQFVWPTQGTITQRFSWYHKGIDIANRAAPPVLAADAGKVIVAGWPDGYGYGNRVIIDHGNGYTTLYGHLARIYVVAGQTVARGSQIGQMGSTGRSTGTHLHFEVRSASGNISPLTILK